MAQTATYFTMSDGVRLAADEYGDKNASAVLFLHGGGQTRHAWDHAATAVAERGWRAVTLDLRGHGESDWSPESRYGLDAFASDITSVAGRLGRPILVGASLGGIASLAAIGGSPAPLATALILVDVVPRLEVAGVSRIVDFMRQGMGGFDSLDAVADAVAAYLPHRRRPRDVSGLLKNVRLRPDGRWYWHWDPAFLGRMNDEPSERSDGGFATDRLYEAANRVSVPTLVIRGGSSDVVSADGVADLLTAIPHAELVEVPQAGHMVAGDRNDRFAAAILEFLPTVA